MNREEIIQRLQEIEAEKKHLLQLLQETLPVAPTTGTNHPPRAAETLSTPEKIRLFLELFGCRRDVYPAFWRNDRTGKKGYSPVCENQWKPGICDKPRVKCSDCKHQAFREMDRAGAGD